MTEEINSEYLEEKLLSEEPEWSDLVPISQPEGLEPVVQILYNKEYSDAMGLLRAIMMKGELSARALHLTSVIIFMNSAHFTVWEFRRCVLHAMKSKGAWLGELEFMMEINQINTKNYQLWNHRRSVVKMLIPLPSEAAEAGAEGGSGGNGVLRMDTLRSDHTLEKELAHLNAILEEDQKHYHAWAHRQWLMRRYCRGTGGIDLESELSFSQQFLTEDPYNNSAWVYRMMLVVEFKDEIPSDEVQFVIHVAEKTGDNEAVWTYLVGLCRHLENSEVEACKRCCRSVMTSGAKQALVNLCLRLDQKEEALEAIKACKEMDPFNKSLDMKTKYLRNIL